MAADSGVWTGDIVTGTTTKLIRLPDGSICAGTGPRAVILQFHEWMQAGHLDETKPKPVTQGEFAALWLTQNGIFHVDGEFRIFSAAAKYAAEGAHQEFILGAMAAGAGAPEAVGLAIQFGAWTRGPVEVMTL